MASTYDFRNLERDLSLLQREYDKFDSSFDAALKPIMGATFDSGEYGAKEIERKLNKIVENSKRDISNGYNELVNDLRRYAHDSTERIKAAGREVVSAVDYYNNKIDTINKINNAFSGNDFRSVVTLAAALLNDENNNVANYARLLTLESEERICWEALGSLSISNYGDFYRYYADATSFGIKHLKIAQRYLFESSSFVLTHLDSSFDSEKKYRISSLALRCYAAFETADKEKYKAKKDAIYKIAIVLFNELTDKYYRGFLYSKVKKIISDCRYFDKSEIKNKFFVDSGLDEKKVFSFLKEYGSHGSDEEVELAFNDTKSLAVSDSREAYFDYWFRAFDERGWAYCEVIINMQENRYSANKIIAETIQNNCAYIRNIGDLFLKITQNYDSFLHSNEDAIDLDLFADAAIVLNETVNRLKSFASNDDEGIKIKNAFDIIDGLAYGMIVKYSKLYAQYDESKIRELNNVLDDCSNRLYGKPYRKNLTKDRKKPTLGKLNTRVKLSTAESQRKSKRNAIIFGCIAAAAVITIVVIIIMMLMK